MKEEAKINIIKNGPHQVSADVLLSKEVSVGDRDNDPLKWEKEEEHETKEEYCLCCCDRSRNKPFATTHT